MAFQSVPNVAQVDTLFTQNGELVQNSYYAHFPAGYSQLQLDALAVKVDTRIQADMIPVMPTEVIYLRTEVLGLTIQNDLMATFTTGPTMGSDVSPSCPNNCTLSIKQESGFSGRSARGRVYWIGIPSNKLQAANENRIVAAYVLTITAAILSIRTGIDGEPAADAVLVSRVTGGVERPTGVTFPWISEIAVNDRVDSRRSRLPTS